MKYLVIFLILIGSIGSVSAQYIGNSEDTGLIWPPICLGGSACPPYEEWIKGIFNNAISEPFDKSDTVIVGTIIQVENPDPHSIRYSIDVEFYLKNAQPFDSLSATLYDPVEPKSFPDVLLYNSPVFEKGDLVFVYLKKIDGSFKVLLQSFAIDKHEVRGPPPTIIFPTDPYQRNFEQGEEVVISGIVRKVELYNVAKQGETLDVKVTIYHNDKEIIDDSVGIDSDGKYSYKFHTMKIPPGIYDIDVNFGPSTIGDRITIETNLKYWTPLKQFKSGIAIEDTQCRESLTLVTKHDGSPACVKSESIPKLIERGWTQNFSDKEDILLNHFKDKPEVVAFFAKYEDAQVSVREDHVSYFAGNEEDFRVRMNLYFDENYELDYIDFNCYVDREPQTEVAEHFILKYLEKYDCKKYGT